MSDARTPLAGFISILLEVESYLRIGVAKMLTDPDLLVMLTQELSPNDVTIFGHDAHQSIDIFRMLAN
jgi:hypothetical protein